MRFWPIRKRVAASGFRIPIVASAFLFAAAVLPGCSFLVSSATSQMMSRLSGSILNNNDLDMVETGAPAYFLMLDSLLQAEPENREMLMSAAGLYTSYAGIFVDDSERAGKLSVKALAFAEKAACLTEKQYCDLRPAPFGRFETIVNNAPKAHVPILFSLGNAWAGWITGHKTDFEAIADIGRIEVIMRRIVQLDETYNDGAAYLFLGMLSSLLPPAMGGKPVEAGAYFEKAAELSAGKNLMVKVIYAKHYARMVFDRALHDRLLTEVLEADPEIPGHVLINTFAQAEAGRLLDGADDFF